MAIRAFVSEFTNYRAVDASNSVISCQCFFVDDSGVNIALGQVENAVVDVPVAIDATPQQIQTAMGTAIRSYVTNNLGFPAPPQNDIIAPTPVRV